MFILFSYAVLGLVVSATGFLMFAFPTKYVTLINWYYSKVGFGKPCTVEKYSRWFYRVSGFVLFLASFLIFYALWLQLRTFLK